MRTRFQRLGLIAALASTSLGISMGVGQAQIQQPVRGGTVIFAMGGDPVMTNPVLSSGVAEGLIGCMLYQGLAITTPDWEVHPMLAKSWTISDDGKIYTFELNKANWSDGKPFTSEDVKFSLTEVNPKYGAVYIGAGKAIDRIDTPSPDRAVIHLKEPYGPFLMSQTCTHGGAILPAHIFRGTNPLQNPASADKPIGLGPFMMTEWKRGDLIRMARNPDYREPGKPYLDELIGKIIPQATSRVQALQAGEIDYVSYFYMPTNSYDAVKANSQLSLTPARLPAGIDSMILNVGRKPLDDKRVRQALLIAIDRDYLMKNAFFGTGEVGIAPFTNGIPWALDPKVDYRVMYKFDPARANALLEEAGVKRGAGGIRFKVNIVYAADQADYGSAAAAIKSMWTAIGVDASVEPGDRTVAYKRMYLDRDYDTALGGYNGYSDPALGMARIAATSSLNKTLGNGSGYSNPVVDDLFLKGESATGNAQRAPFYQKAQAILAEDLPVFNLHEKVPYDAASKKVMGLENEIFLATWRDAWRAK